MSSSADTASYSVEYEMCELRVPLSVAVDFVIDLEIRADGWPATDRRVYDPEFRVHDCPDCFDPTFCNDSDTWAHALEVSAEKHGFDSMPDMQKVYTRIEARLAGVASDWDFEHKL
jgi:hypothetical protein